MESSQKTAFKQKKKPPDLSNRYAIMLEDIYSIQFIRSRIDLEYMIFAVSHGFWLN